MTKYSNNRNRGSKPEKDIIVLPNMDQTNENKIYYCQFCNRQLIQLSEEEYYCSNDIISFFPNSQNVKSKSQLITPDGPATDPLVSYLPDPHEIKKKDNEPKGTFAEMRKRGIKITNYQERNWKEEKS